MRPVEHVPKSQGLVPSSCQYRLPIWTVGQVKHSVRVPCQCGHFIYRILLPIWRRVPYIYLVQAVTMGSHHLVRYFWKHQVAYLRTYIILFVPVSIAKLCYKVLVEKKRMCLSAVPPPDANIDGLLGHHPMAFTAALCSWNFTSSEAFLCEYTTSLLSLPPDAILAPSGLHLRPHISCPWALYLLTIPLRKSQVATVPSLDPLARRPVDQSKLPTLPLWPSKLLFFFILIISKTLICPVLFPMANLFSSQKDTEQM